MGIIDAIILGFVEGATEFLPVSSTGHLILANALLGNDITEFAKTFEIAIQSGAILAVLVLYWKSFTNLDTLTKIIVAFIPTGIIGLLSYSFLKNYLLESIPTVLGALLIGGLVLIIFDYYHNKHPEDEVNPRPMSYKDAALIGVFQAIAIIPGVSRSAATILGGLALGFSRMAIVEFSFLLAVPTLLAATGLDLYKNGLFFTNGEWVLLIIGFAVSFVVALFAIRWLISYVQSNSFTVFGVYRILIALIFIPFLFF